MATFSIPPVGPGWQLSALIARYRFSHTLEREVIGILEDAYRAIARQLQQLPELHRRDTLLLAQQFAEIRKLLTEAYGTARTTASPILREYAALEREIALQQADAIRRVTSALGLGNPSVIAQSIGASGVSVGLGGVPRQLVVSSARLIEIVEAIDVGGIGFGPWWDRAREDGILRVRRMIQTGIVRGQNPTAIANSIWQARNAGGPNAWRQSRTVLRTAVRTVTTAIQNEAALTAQQSYHDVIGKYRFEAILDSRTSDICRPLDGSLWAPNDPKMPVPPLHPNCRSTLVPIPNIEGIDVPNSPRKSYEQWLREQGPNTQNAILGRGIAEHWRAGKVKLSDLLSVDRRPLSLAQLRRVLYAVHPESYAGWLSSLSPSAQDAVLGTKLGAQFRSGTATLDAILNASVRSGVVQTAAPPTP